MGMLNTFLQQGWEVWLSSDNAQRSAAAAHAAEVDSKPHSNRCSFLRKRVQNSPRNTLSSTTGAAAPSRVRDLPLLSGELHNPTVTTFQRVKPQTGDQFPRKVSEALSPLLVYPLEGLEKNLCGRAEGLEMKGLISKSPQHLSGAKSPTWHNEVVNQPLQCVPQLQVSVCSLTIATDLSALWYTVHAILAGSQPVDPRFSVLPHSPKNHCCWGWTGWLNASRDS